MAEERKPPADPDNVSHADRGAPVDKAVEPAAEREVSNSAGVFFMLAMFLVLGGVLYGYFYLHHSRPQWTTQPFDEDLTLIVETALAQVQQAPTLDASSPAAESVTVATGVFESLQAGDEPLFGDNKGKIVASLLSQAGKAVENSDKAACLTALKTLQEASLNHSTFFWGFYPWRLLEVLFWALVATLIRLIINAGWYIYQQKFYRQAIAHHVSLIVTAPILAVLIAFVLSLVKVSIQLSDLELSLDMTNVAIAILVGALIGLTPWKAWDFMKDLAGVFFDKLSELTGRSAAAAGERAAAGGSADGDPAPQGEAPQGEAPQGAGQ